MSFLFPFFNSLLSFRLFCSNMLPSVWCSFLPTITSLIWTYLRKILCYKVFLSSLLVASCFTICWLLAINHEKHLMKITWGKYTCTLPPAAVRRLFPIIFSPLSVAPDIGVLRVHCYGSVNRLFLLIICIGLLTTKIRQVFCFRHDSRHTESNIRVNWEICLFN
jgi:hypothetical protein